jgi:hypothetical protein
MSRFKIITNGKCYTWMDKQRSTERSVVNKQACGLNQ